MKAGFLTARRETEAKSSKIFHCLSLKPSVWAALFTCWSPSNAFTLPRTLTCSLPPTRRVWCNTTQNDVHTHTIWVINSSLTLAYLAPKHWPTDSKTYEEKTASNASIYILFFYSSRLNFYCVFTLNTAEDSLLRPYIECCLMVLLLMFLDLQILGSRTMNLINQHV